jgi:rRNA maturation protein Nop10
MLYCFGGPPVTLVPRCCPEVQLHDSFRAFTLQEAVQEIGEEVVVAVPSPLVVQSDDKQALSIEPLQHLLPVVYVGNRVAQVSRKALENRCFEKK